MLKILLNDGWLMLDGDRAYACAVPCSAYDTLIRASAIPDPYYRENEWISTPVSDRDFTVCFIWFIFKYRLKYSEDSRISFASISRPTAFIPATSAQKQEVPLPHIGSSMVSVFPA